MFQHSCRIIFIAIGIVLVQCMLISEAVSAGFSSRIDDQIAIASKIPPVVAKEDSLKDPYTRHLKNMNPYADRNGNKKKKNFRMRNKKNNKLVLNMSTCRDISYQLAQQWDPTLSQSPPPSPAAAAGAPLALSLASTFSLCPSSPPLKTLNDTIDLVCHIRVDIQPKITMVSLARCLATAWLTLAALRLPHEGAIVETGTWRGGMSILSLMLMKKYDHCSATAATGGEAGREPVIARKFWAFDS